MDAIWVIIAVVLLLLALSVFKFRFYVPRKASKDIDGPRLMPSDPELEELVLHYLKTGDRVEAVRQVRQRKQVTLREADTYVRHLETYGRTSL